MDAAVNLIKPMGANQKSAKKRSIRAVCEYFEPIFGAANAASANLQGHPL